MKRYAFFLSLICLINSGCDQQALHGMSCPATPVDVMKVVYQESASEYLVFHTTAAGQKGLPNPLHIANLQMQQMQKTSEKTADVARINFKLDKGQCTPILEMTQGFKIELQQGASSHASSASGSSSGSYWAPFLMGAVAGHLLSSPTHAAGPAYYLPPPVGSQTVSPGGVVTGGVSARNSEELHRQYESKYASTNEKKGFFSRSRSSSQTAAADHPSKPSGGFFSSGGSAPKKSGGFFRKK